MYREQHRQWLLGPRVLVAWARLQRLNGDAEKSASALIGVGGGADQRGGRGRVPERAVVPGSPAFIDSGHSGRETVTKRDGWVSCWGYLGLSKSYEDSMGKTRKS